MDTTTADAITAALTAAGIPARDINGATVRRIHEYTATVTVHGDPTDHAGTWWYATDDYDGAVLAESYDLEAVARGVRTWWEK